MVLNTDQRFLCILVFSALIIGTITIYVAVNHQQNIDEQILSGAIHMLNTTDYGVEPTFTQNYNKNKYKVGRFDYVENYNGLSSSNSSFNEWNNLVNYIYQKYYQYNAFIIIINTDTLLYTSVALSFMLEGLDKPIIFTDNQHVFSTLLLASQTKIPEVMISSNNSLFRAVRTQYYGNNNFSSPNYYPLTHKNCLANNINELPKIKYLNSNLTIPLIKIFPGIDGRYMESFINNDKIHGIVIELWGDGSSPLNIGFIKAINELTKKGVIILCIPHNKLFTGNNIDITLLEAGCLNGGNITLETAYIKLAFLLSNVSERKLIGKLMDINFRGELDNYY
jgi:L-asparaginase